MKSLLFGLLVLSAANINANETREYKKVSSTEAVVEIQTGEEHTQAAIYVDAKENAKFIEDLRKDSNSSLAKLIKEIELGNCGVTSTPESTWIDGCGEVVITKETMTSFGRGGWASAGAGYKFFVGFVSDGSGRFFDSSHIVTIFESSEAQTKEDTYEFNGVIIKTLTLGKIEAIAE